MKRTLAFAQTDGLMVLVHSKEAPSDPEWDRWIEAWFACLERGQPSRLLIVTDGGAPNSGQRHRMSQQIQSRRGQALRAALLSESMFARLVLNLLIAMEATWFGGFYRAVKGEHGASQIYRAFGRQELRSALPWLELPPSREADVRRLIADLEAELARG
jgi:hypothetical protein